MIKHDNIHLDGRRLDSYNKPFNFFITERETGKSSWAYSKMYKTFVHRHRPSILIRRRINDITDIWINDVGETINQFLKTPIELDFKKGSFRSGENILGFLTGYNYSPYLKTVFELLIAALIGSINSLAASKQALPRAF